MSIFSSCPESCRVSVSENVTVQGNVTVSPNCKSISIGFGSFIGRDIYIDAESLSIGDYTTIHHGSVIQGKEILIGHNCWIGHYSILDGTGGCYIGNNVGVGAHSQLWSHMKFGDVLEGCRFNSQSKLVIEDDVWLVGHSLLGPITAKKKSLLLTGSFATKNLEENCIYWGNPAELMPKMKGQFRARNTEAKRRELESLVDSFKEKNDTINLAYKILNANDFDVREREKGITQFDVERRLYMPTRSHAELCLIKYLLYDKAKFLPVN